MALLRVGLAPKASFPDDQPEAVDVIIRRVQLASQHLGGEADEGFGVHLVGVGGKPSFSRQAGATQLGLPFSVHLKEREKKGWSR